MPARLKKYLLLSAALFFVVVGAVAPALPVSAACAKDEQEISLPVDQGGTKCIKINASSANINDNPIYFYLRNLLYIAGGGVGLAVVGGLVYGSYMYITARGNASQAQQGQNVIINSVIGLFLFIFMFAILQFLVPGGIFQ